MTDQSEMVEVLVLLLEEILLAQRSGPKDTEWGANKLGPVYICAEGGICVEVVE